VNASAVDRTKLIGLADRPGGDVKARLLLALTALYVERKIHTDEEKRQYAELAQRLLDVVDANTRSVVIAILRDHPSAPAEIVGQLPPASSLGPAAAPTPGDSPIATVVPACPQAPDTVKAPPAPIERGEAFFAATAAGRRELLTLIAKECEGEDAGDQPPADCERLDAAVLEGRIGELIRELERVLDLPRSLCERIVNDPLGEPIVVAAAAARIPIAVVQRVLLLINPAVSHSVERVFDLTNLYYELDRRAANRMISLWRETTTREEGLSAPVTRQVAAQAERAPLPLRARFGALAERIQDRSVTSRSDRESAGLRDLRSR
jgi:2-oxo-4-hydroxy-4-carboxy--5-ureidoimidazoline (OHCU) decarboxylase